MITTILLVTLTTLCITLYLYSIKKFNYWKKKNVPHLKPTLILGNYGDYILLKRNFGEVAQSICRKFPKAPYVGTYFGTEPALLLQDPDLIKLILVKDFVYFNGREISNHTHKEPITRSLFFTYGDRWKIFRQTMSPIFTSSKIKNMFHLFQKCAEKFDKMLEKETKESQELDTVSIAARYTMDCICSSGFGIEVNTMDVNTSIENNRFYKIGTLIFEASKIRGISLATRSIWPSIFYGFGLSLFPRVIYDFFDNVLKKVSVDRDYKPSDRNDFVDISLGFRKNGSVTCESLMTAGETFSLEVDDDFMVQQSLNFFGAGFETSATILGYTLYELAKDEENQNLVVEEVDEYLRKHDGKIEFDCTTDLPYLNAVVDETLRLYPVLGVVTREVMKDYTLPDGLRLDRGVRIHIPLFHLHRNPDFFPEPEKFKPERFLPENRQDVRPFTYLPFGEGPRICVGMRIAKTQMIPGLITVLRKYRVSLGEGMPRKMEFDSRTFITTAKNGIRLKFLRRAS